MKKLLLSAFVLLFSFNTKPSPLKGKIKYKITATKNPLDKENNKYSKEKNERFRKVAAEFLKASKKLSFSLNIAANASLFSLDKQVNTDDASLQDSFIVKMYDANYYSDTKEILCQEEAYGQQFLITRPIPQWKIADETKKIGNYECIKATTIETINKAGKKRTVTAWFAPSIPLAFGPRGYVGLPGLILRINYGEGLTYQATEIALGEDLEVSIKKPTKGKKVSNEEFLAIGAEMRARWKEEH